MNRLLTAFLASMLAASAWANPCATGGRPFPAVDGSGLGGTGHVRGGDDGTGVGGTGHAGDSGMGGTGRQARDGDGSGMGGTGIVGEITGFGSICVNGLEVHYDAQTPVSIDGRAGKADRLAIGQIVAVHASGRGNELRARHIQVRHALVGRVEAVNRDGQLRVWGQWVNPPLMSRVQSGERIKVSGYRADAKHVVASRIDPALPDESDVVSGEVEWVQGDTAQVGGVRVQLPKGVAAVAGDEIRVSGKAEGSGLRAQRVEPDGVRGLLDKVERLSVKDRVRPASGPGKLRVGGAEFSVDANTRIGGGKADGVRPGQLVHIDARQKDGRLIVDRIEVREAGDRRGEADAEGARPRAPQPADRAGHEEAESEDHEAHAEREDGASAAEKSEKIEGSEKDRDSEKVEKSERMEKSEKAERAARSEASEEREKPETTARLERTERHEASERQERSDKPEKAEKAERVEKPEKAEKPEKVERSEKVERPEKAERLEKAERPERVEKPEKVERPERVERYERVERPERPEIDD